MNGLIDKQEAIKALGERPLLWTGGDYELGRANQYDADLAALQSTPTVQPSEADLSAHGLAQEIVDILHDKHNVAMTDLIVIDKQAVINAVIKECNSEGAYGYMDAKSIIDLLKRMSETIVRCKDCALWNDGKCDTWSALGVTILTAETGYCNFGDRRDNG